MDLKEAPQLSAKEWDVIKRLVIRLKTYMGEDAIGCILRTSGVTILTEEQVIALAHKLED